MKITGHNPLEMHLNQTYGMIVEDTDTVKGNSGDVWRRHEVVKNQYHPDWNVKNPPEHSESEEGILHALDPIHIWHNERTNQCHQGEMRLGTNGRAEPCDLMNGREPKMYHSDHYLKVEGNK
jgi:hypothetical protein